MTTCRPASVLLLIYEYILLIQLKCRMYSGPSYTVTEGLTIIAISLIMLLVLLVTIVSVVFTQGET